MRCELTVDVLVVGLGPAGACAAAAAARAGLRVLAIDRRTEAGLPVQCAELVPAMIGQEIAALGRARRQPIRSMTTFVEAAAPHIKEHFPGHMIDRAAFDAALVDEARAAGADCRFSTVLRRLDSNGVAYVATRSNRAYTTRHPGRAAACNGAAQSRDLAAGTASDTQDPVSAVHRARCTAHGMTGEGGEGVCGSGLRLDEAALSSPPLDGEGGAAEPRGWGGAQECNVRTRAPPPLTPPRKGEGRRVCRCCFNLSRTDSRPAGAWRPWRRTSRTPPPSPSRNDRRRETSPP